MEHEGREAGAMTPVLYEHAVCSRSLSLFLRHHNLRYLWSVFSMSLLHYFLPKGTTLVNAAVRAHCERASRAPRGTPHLLVIEHSINKLHLRLSCSVNKRN